MASYSETLAKVIELASDLNEIDGVTAVKSENAGVIYLSVAHTEEDSPGEPNPEAMEWVGVWMGDHYDWYWVDDLQAPDDDGFLSGMLILTWSTFE